MSTPPSELPPPAAPPTSQPGPGQMVGQQVLPATRTNTLALVSFITALVAPLGHFTGVGGITLIVISIVTGHMARGQIRRTGEGGASLALAGLIISYIHLALSVLVFVFFFGLIIAAFTGVLGGSH